MASIRASLAAQAFVGDFESATITPGQIPTGKWGFWFDTTELRLYLVKNRAGILFLVELSSP